MPNSPIPAPPNARHRATWWDRLAIVLLGIAGCALSFDALRQMATAVHVRHQLTYLFPVVIDGFIAYGVRALLVLREAPLPARLYAWTLFIAATCASIWANGLHALDLNQPGTAALRLDDATVAVLSATAPLALAGATHLHILITRYGTAPTSITASRPERRGRFRAVHRWRPETLQRFRTAIPLRWQRQTTRARRVSPSARRPETPTSQKPKPWPRPYLVPQTIRTAQRRNPDSGRTPQVGSLRRHQFRSRSGAPLSPPSRGSPTSSAPHTPTAPG